MIRFILILFTTLIYEITLDSQSLQIKNIPFIVNGKELKYACAGGINNAQVNQADINFDGFNDIIIFDKLGDVMVPFVYDPLIGDYVYSYEAKRLFPVVKDWVLFRDYNKDGAIDIFSSSSNTQGPFGVEVHRGIREGNQLKFELVRQPGKSFDILFYPVGNGETQIPVDYTDLPGLDDVDNDGDLDILNYLPGGSTVEFFKNIAVERGWSLDSLRFISVDKCYGQFAESGFTQEITLSTNEIDCAQFRNPGNSKRHAGSTILSTHLDGNGLKDLLIGDLTSSNIIGLFNNGSSTNAWMSRQEELWPANDAPVSINIWNSAFEADFNRDGLMDIFIAPNQRYNSENVKNLWYYQNFGTVNSPLFELFRKDIFVGDMVDMGSGISPCFLDYNQDGLMDLLLGTEGIYKPGNTREAGLVLFKNTGTKKNPQFTLVDSNYLDFRLFSSGQDFTYNFSPTVGDLDNDGDQDMLVGEYKGYMFYLENIAGPGIEFVFKNPVYPYKDIFVNQYSAPELVDLNRDGLMDIVIGGRLGNNNAQNEACSSFRYYQNIGTTNEANFNPNQTELPNTVCLGNAMIQGEGSKVNSSPEFYDFDGKYRMFSGGLLGESYVFTEIEGNIYNNFTKAIPNYGQMREGERTHLDIADIDDDGILDMVVGNQRGGISIFNTEFRVDGTIVSTKSITVQDTWSMFPNPVQQTLHIRWEEPQSGTLKVFNLNGMVVITNEIKEQSQFELELGQLNKACYIIQFINANKLFQSRITKL
ncbi:MAG: T9SS type A sorting domain-containing protein [Bacteroidota bacterium]|nr:T9SS type A sorting domain-containing protein [Bacteroidota bacterium]